VSRFSQAISEGDGISVIPVLEGDVEALAALAEAAGAEAIAVRAEDVERARAQTGLAIVARTGDPEAVSAAGADALVVSYQAVSDEGRLEQLYAVSYELGLDFAVDVREEDELEEVLERIDPEVVLISERGLDRVGGVPNLLLVEFEALHGVALHPVPVPPLLARRGAARDLLKLALVLVEAGPDRVGAAHSR